MDKETEDAARDRKIDELNMKARKLDDICHEIFLTLLAKKRLRFNELHRQLKKFGTDVSKPTLIDHLKHLSKQKLIKRRREGQNVSYGLTEEISELMDVSKEDLTCWINALEKGVRFKELRPIKWSEYYRKLTEKQLDQEIDRDLRETLSLTLFELRTFINYDLKIDKHESNAAFWNFVGNPLYRIHEKGIVEKCRDSDEYRKRLFEKMEVLIKELRSGKQIISKT